MPWTPCWAAPASRLVPATSGRMPCEAAAGGFAVILLDVKMPGMDGFETARLIRRRDACRHIPIIFLTATGSDVDLIYKAYSVGAVDYLIKPLQPEIVRAKVDVFLELHRRALRIRRQELQLREAERQRGEEALRESQNQYAATFNQAPVGIAHLSLDGRWLLANRHLCDMLGYAEAELRGLRYQDVADPETVVADLQALQALAQQPGAADGAAAAGPPIGARAQRETRLTNRSGNKLWVELNVSLIGDRPEGRHFVVIVEDVTGRRRAEERRGFPGRGGGGAAELAGPPHHAQPPGRAGGGFGGRRLRVRGVQRPARRAVRDHRRPRRCPGGGGAARRAAGCRVSESGAIELNGQRPAAGAARAAGAGGAGDARHAGGVLG